MIKLGSTTKVKHFFNYLCDNLGKELIIFFDEADCLSEKPLITFLRQIRNGYNSRTEEDRTKLSFPSSMALIGMRDIRDYIAKVRPGSESKGISSPFNIKKEALTLANFTQDEIGTLYKQHTEASGQIFEPDAIERAWYWTEGQPWLVNALAYETITKILNKDYTVTVTKDMINSAAEAIIKRRDTHIDSLLERLKEPRIRRVIQPVILGKVRLPDDVTDDDKQYVIDLGLLKIIKGKLKPANPIYSEVILRTLSNRYQEELPEELENKWMDGNTLDMTSLLKEFQTFWRNNSEMMGNPYNYNETIPHLVCFAYLQRVINGGVQTLSREFALGMKRVDLNAIYQGHSYPVEIKLKGEDKFEPLRHRDALAQIQGYMNTCGAKEGWLVIFDRDPSRTWDEKITWNTVEFQEKTIHIVGC
jgi:hypothetical protein